MARLQDDAKRSLIANTVQISAYRPPRGGAGEMKLCLNFSDLVFEGKHCEDLEGPAVLFWLISVFGCNIDVRMRASALAL